MSSSVDMTRLRYEFVGLRTSTFFKNGKKESLKKIEQNIQEFWGT
jgi:hypothetical protein